MTTANNSEQLSEVRRTWQRLLDLLARQIVEDLFEEDDSKSPQPRVILSSIHLKNLPES